MVDGPLGDALVRQDASSKKTSRSMLGGVSASTKGDLGCGSLFLWTLSAGRSFTFDRCDRYMYRCLPICLIGSRSSQHAPPRGGLWKHSSSGQVVLFELVISRMYTSFDL